jgi:hypothetical protein
VTGSDVTPGDARAFSGAIQGILRKDSLTQEKLVERLRSLGIAPATKTAAGVRA